MKSLLTSTLIFAVGAIIGSTVTWKLIKTKYEQIAQEEIDSVKETFSRLHEESTDKDERAKMAERAKGFIDNKNKKPDIKEFAAKLKECEYVKYSDSKEDKERKTVTVNKPYVISPEEFGEADYNIVSLNYYADGVLANDFDEVVEDVENTVGEDFEEHFGDYEEDSVFVRNDELGLDYEILRDMRNFSDVVKNHSHHTEDE